MENMYNLKYILEILPVQSKHITVNVPRRGWGKKEVPTKKLAHLTQRETVQAVQAILCSLLLSEPDKDVALLLPEGPSHAHHLAEL